MFVFKNKKLLFLILLLAALLPYFFISIYANPAADDFKYNNHGKDFNALQFLFDIYMQWNGRYTSNAFILISPLVFRSFISYKIVPVLLLILTSLSYLFFVKVLIGRFIDKMDSYLIALLLTLLFLYQMPIISEGIYWYSGSITYQMGNICAVTYMSLLIMYYGDRFIFNNRGIHLLLLTIALSISIGFNEIMMITLFCFSVMLFFITYKNKLRHRALANYLLAVTFIFSAIMFFAPGNAQRAAIGVRESGITDHHNVAYSLGFSLAQAIRFFLKWICSIPLLILSVLYFYLNRSVLKRHPLFSSSFYLSPVYSSMLLFLIIFIAAFPSYWMFGLLGQHRTMNVAWYVFIILWFINLTVWFNRYENRLSHIPTLSGSTTSILMFILLGSLLFTKNGYNVTADLASGKAKSFDEQMKERYALVQSAQDTIRFSPIANPPKTIFTYDITDDPGHWLNTCYTDYFQCQNKVVLRK